MTQTISQMPDSVLEIIFLATTILYLNLGFVFCVLLVKKIMFI